MMIKQLIRILIWGIVVSTSLTLPVFGAGTAQVLTIDGPIGPATADYIDNGFDTALERDAVLIVLTMDTPGGLTDSMRAIIQHILDSPVPVVGYVYPQGSRAASAGTYILYACHVAAMAPGTNLGAATPVRISGGLPVPGKEKPPPDHKDPAPSGNTPKDAMEAKMVNDAVAYIRSLAEMRGRNGDWAERAVREGASLPVNEALELNVIDLIAGDIPTLLEAIDGRQVSVSGRQETLDTEKLSVETIEPGWANRLLAIITNPNIAFMLILVGVYGLVFEFSNPGSIGPGVVGVICLIVGLYALNVLPLNYAGLGLLLFSLAMMAAEAFVPSFGVLGIGGIIAFVLASLMLFDTDIPGFGISWPVIASTAVLSGLLMIFLLGYVWKTQRRAVTTGEEAMVGREGEVLNWTGDSGYVRVGGERWQAYGENDLSPGDRVEVQSLRGLSLVVKKKDN